MASPEQTATGKDISNPFMVVMTYQKSYSYQHTMIHVQNVENGFSPPWISTLLVANGLTSPRVNGYLVKAHKIHSYCCDGLMLTKINTMETEEHDDAEKRRMLIKKTKISRVTKIHCECRLKIENHGRFIYVYQ